MPNFYKPNKVTWGGITFDSCMEYNIFNLLRCYFSLSQIKVHLPLIVRPSSPWFPETKWKVDYCITNVPDLNGNKLYIEVKGLVTTEFKEKMKSLAYFCPAVFENLVIITEKPQTIVRGFRSIDESCLDSFLTEKQYSELVNFCKVRR